MAPRIVDRDAKRAHILMAATEVFSQKGFDATRMQDVARAAGVGKATLYEYFADKATLTMAVFDAFMEHANAGLVAPTASTLRGQLLELAKQLQDMMAEGELLFPLMVEFWRASVMSPEAAVFQARFRAVYAQFDAWVVGLVEAAKARGEVRAEVDAERFAAAFDALHDGLAIQHWFFGRADLYEVIAQQIDLLCRGMAPEEGAA